ncbi:hypothetical protein CF65_02475 [Aggregatibacter actinomycetemcomitans HK1651]|nr:hypothetical protein CF65_02475 [Aggregatibacter actinomycetemcomitans HK1651]
MRLKNAVNFNRTLNPRVQPVAPYHKKSIHAVYE